MRIGFHSNQLGLRGTEIALYEYAFYAREFFGIEPVIISDKNSDLGALDKFKKEYPVYLYENFNEVVKWVDDLKLDAVYYQKAGFFDNKIVPNAQNLVHCVFQMHQPHGERYAYISEWLANKANWPHYVPYMVDIAKYKHDDNLREYLNIPKTATVFGYHGGRDSFNIPWVQETVSKVASVRNDVYFVFMNVNPFGEERSNIIFLEGTHDLYTKVSFINTCDAMIHGRNGGESFGLSIGEFSMLNKPVLTTSWCTAGLHDEAQMDILKDKGIFYTMDTLYELLTTLVHKDFDGKDWNAHKEYSPQNVMNKFKEVFL
jgi:hypothetical protein